MDSRFRGNDIGKGTLRSFAALDDTGWVNALADDDASFVFLKQYKRKG